MMIQLQCQCGTVFWADASELTTTVRCTSCGQLHDVAALTEHDADDLEPAPSNNPAGSNNAAHLVPVFGSLAIVFAVGAVLIWAILERQQATSPRLVSKIEHVDRPLDPVLPPEQPPSANSLIRQTPRTNPTSVHQLRLNWVEVHKLCNPAVATISTEDQSAVGAGFFVSADGLLITNHHVVASCGKVSNMRVRLPDQRVWRVDRVIRDDPRADLALLKVSGQGFPFLTLAGQEPSVGAEIAAIGSPLGFSNSLSNGIVSGFREINGVRCVQHTAATGPGNSGGPLISTQGTVVGVSTLAIARLSQVGNGSSGSMTIAHSLNFGVSITEVHLIIRAANRRDGSQ